MTVKAIARAGWFQPGAIQFYGGMMKNIHWDRLALAALIALSLWGAANLSEKVTSDSNNPIPLLQGDG
jgi:hypothetical protein